MFAYAKSAAPPCPPLGGALSWSLPASDIVRSGPLLAATRNPGADDKAVSVLVASPAYDGAVTVSRDGRMVFTSTRDGDPELYVAGRDGDNARRLTSSPGYDGQARFAPNGSQVAWQAERLTGDAAAAAKEPLASGRVAPNSMHIVVAGPDGQHPRIVTRGSAMHITPSFLPDSRRIIYASDYDSVSKGEVRNFELYLVDPSGPLTATQGPRVERITYDESFDGEAMVSPNGRWIVFTSSRNARPGETNLFVARWSDE